jgi:hypothetical protein
MRKAWNNDKKTRKAPTTGEKRYGELHGERERQIRALLAFRLLNLRHLEK